MTKDALKNKERLFDWWASNYDFFLVSVFYQAVHKRLLKYVNLPDAVGGCFQHRANILDIGCGTGRLLDRLASQFPELRGTGLDLSAEMLHQARRRNRYGDRLIYVQGNAESLPFADGQFDAVFNTISFLHYPEPERVFSEVSRVLRPGGQFYLVDSLPSQLTSKQLRGSFPWIGEIRLYSQMARQQLGLEVRLNCLEHHYLLGPVLLTIFTKLEN